MKNAWLVLLCVVIGEFSWAASELILDKAASSVEFLAIGRPSALKIRGTKGKPEGRIKIAGSVVEGELSLDLSTLETGISLRDRHMKEKYLEVGKEGFRHAVLNIKKVSLPVDYWKNPKPQITTFDGILKLHGVEKEMNGQIEIKEANLKSLGGIAKFTLSLPQYGIAIPSFSGITMADQVDVEIKFKSQIESK